MRAIDGEDGDECCRDCTVLCRNARTVADRMHLRDWTITVGHDLISHGDSIMTVDLHAERKVLRLRRAEEFYDLDELERRHHLTHELVHPLLRDLYETVRRGAEHEFGGAAYRMFMTQVRLEKERAVDILASVIAPTMPVLEW